MKRLGKQTVYFENPPFIYETASTVGEKEGKGPLSEYFDVVLNDDYYGEDSWEKAESRLQKENAMLALKKAGLLPSDINYILAGDLLNQCIGTHYALRDIKIPFFGLYGACSTMAEGLSLAGMIIDGGFAEYVMTLTSSHFCSSEKQFRFPLEYGGQRAPSAQWTVTGTGCAIVGDKSKSKKDSVFITHVTTGVIEDKGITDAANMGAAMAPAVFGTLKAHFEDTNFTPDDYDLILTGDLGEIGSNILVDCMKKAGYNIERNHNDCGKMIFDKTQDAHAGGSGCGCIGSVFCGFIMDRFRHGEFKNILLIGTGALMNTAIVQQGESIPAIAHAVRLSRGE